MNSRPHGPELYNYRFVLFENVLKSVDLQQYSCYNRFRSLRGVNKNRASLLTKYVDQMRDLTWRRSQREKISKGM